MKVCSVASTNDNLETDIRFTSGKHMIKTNECLFTEPLVYEKRGEIRNSFFCYFHAALYFFFDKHLEHQGEKSRFLKE